MISKGWEYIWQIKILPWIITSILVIFNVGAIFSMGFWGLLLSGIISLIFMIPICFIFGFAYNVKTYSKRKEITSYTQMFEELNLFSPGGEYPSFIRTEENEFLKIYGFHSKIPLEVWEAKRNHLERYFKARIIRIQNQDDNNNIVLLYVEKQPLPTMITFQPKHLLVGDVLHVGTDAFGQVAIELNKTPHAFVCGETGSGKSVILKCLIYQCLTKEYDVKLVDFKRGVSFADFSEFVEIYSDFRKIQMLLETLVQETNDRLDVFLKNRVENINQYNQNRYGNDKMRRIVLFVDELAELMRSSDKEANKAITASLETLTRLSRAVGINLIMGLQRPDSTIINGQIKNNVACRICGRFVDPEPSRIMLGNDFACHLPNIKGRFIYKDGMCREFQAFYLEYKDMFYLHNNRPKLKDEEQNQIEIAKKEQELQQDLDFCFDDII